MHFGRVEIETLDGPEARIVVAADSAPERWIDVRAAERLRLERAGATSAGARRLAAARCPGQLSAALEAGPAFLGAASAAAACEDEKVLAPPSARVLAPLDPVAYRDFMAFEQHFVTATQKLRGTPPPPVLHELPVSYFGNAHAVLGPDEEIPWPHYTDHMDYELKLGIVIGTAGTEHPAGGRARPRSRPERLQRLHRARHPAARDGSRARPLQGQALRLGPRAADRHVGRAARRAGDGGAGQRRGLVRGLDRDAEWSIAELVAWASAGEPLAAGTLLGSGTVGGGCGIELDRKLEPGDVVELEIEGIGVLRNRLGQPARDGWLPTPRTPSTFA